MVAGGLGQVVNGSSLELLEVILAPLCYSMLFVVLGTPTEDNPPSILSGWCLAIDLLLCAWWIICSLATVDILIIVLFFLIVFDCV